MAARFQWCQEREHWGIEWDQIMFGNKPQFCLCQNNRWILVQRFRRKWHSIECAVCGHFGVTPDVLEKSSIGIEYRSFLGFINGKLNAYCYIDKILRLFLLHLLNKYPGVVFQRDNTRPHIARICRNVLQEAEVEVLSWLACSLDLNFIEHVWSIMGGRLRGFRP